MSEIALKAAGLRSRSASERIQSSLTTLLVVGTALIVCGATASFSTTVFLRIAQGLPPYSVFFKHLLFALAGISVSLATVWLFAAVPGIRRWLKYIIPVFFFVSLSLVIAVKFSSHGVNALGATRGLNLGFISFQPSELMKISLVLYLAQLLCWWRTEPGQPAETQQQPDRTNGGFASRLLTMFSARPVYPSLPVHCVIVLLAAVGFTVIQPDLGSACIIFCAGLITAIIAGVRMRQLLYLVLGFVLVGCLMMVALPGKYNYVKQRLATWVNPLENSDSASYQITQARGAIAEGGLWGKGYLRSDQKMNRLPLSTNDFVFPVIVEELGFIGGIVIIALFILLGLTGIRLAGDLKEPFAGTVVAALGLTICLQGLINIGTTIGTLPLSGLTLPFFSQGGTSLIVSIAAIGLMYALGFSGLQAARQAESAG